MTATTTAPTALAVCRQSIATHSKSFSMASKLLPAASRDDAAIVYAWCRRADDAIDESPRAQQRTELARIRAELDAIYRGEVGADPVLGAFRDVVDKRAIPREYPAELIAGMEMDTNDQSYPDMETLLLYCYRVASTVGLMMSHVIGLRSDEALVRAAHMGIAMQLTNICRDVVEDWERGRLYLPDALLARHGAGDLRGDLGGPFPDSAARPVASALRELLDLADVYYRSGDRGLSSLPWRAGFGVRVARLVYSAIGDYIAAANYDVRAGRAFVPTWHKLLLVARAGVAAIAELPARGWRAVRGRSSHRTPHRLLEPNHDVIYP